MKTLNALPAALVIWLTSLCATSEGQFEGSVESTRSEPLLPSTGSARLSTSGNCVRVNLPRIGLEFGGLNYRRVWVCPNGMLRFRDGFYQRYPRNFGTYIFQLSDPCLAPYWSLVDLNSFTSGQSRMSVYILENQFLDNTGLFQAASEYGRRLLPASQFDTLWVAVFSWQDLRPINPGNFGGRNSFEVLLAKSVNDESIAVFRYIDIDWSVKAPRSLYSFFQRASDLPVIGWNSGSLFSSMQFQNLAGSGTVRAVDVDAYQDPSLQTSGEIGVVLDNGRGNSVCIRWLNDQFRFQRSPLGCREPCAPTYNQARRVVQSRSRSWWNSLYKRLKRSSTFPFFSLCVFSWSGRFPHIECCYDLFFGYLIESPILGAGRVHRFHPQRFFQRSSFNEEEDVYEDCCSVQNSLLCRVFHLYRPVCTSRGWRRRRPSWGSMFGDPHFVTLDGKNYTFNGCGWYTYFKGEIPGTNESRLCVQVRTSRVADVNATGFTAVVVQEGNGEVVQVNLRSSGNFYVEVNQEEVIVGENLTELASGALLSFENETLSIVTPLENGVRLRSAANGSFFTILTSFSPSYQNSTLGLIGKWNGDIEDDFTLPNGTVLPIDLSESEIFFQFGEQWRVPENETLYRNITDDDDEQRFKCPENFVPVFSDQALASLDETFLRQAEELCGNDVNCLFDTAATGQLAIGQSTLTESTELSNEISTLENNSPVFSQNITSITVTLGETFMLVLEASDPDGEELTFDVPNIPPGASFNSSESTLYFFWNVTSADEANVTFLVQDTRNASSSLSPSIFLCRCVSGGICFVPEATSQETGAVQDTFLVMSCNCTIGRTGEFCEEQKNFCEGESTPPCHPLVTCINNPTNFTCGPCPTGYEGDGISCSDIEECEANTHDCDQICVNSDGSFLCECGSGFTLDQSGKLCNDIDECSQPNDCSQLCNNTVGSHECFCRIGFRIDMDDTTQCIAQTECSQNLCQQICYLDVLDPGVERCECRTGFVLADDQTACDDIDECQSAETHLCDHICNNTVGTYTCLCREGYELGADRTSCTDVDECLEGIFNCTGNEECENLPGGFRCLCPARLNMIRVNGTCTFREDESIRPDMAPDDPAATQEQNDSSIEITLKNFQSENYTIDVDILFKDSVVAVVNSFCNENRLRPQDCGVSQNQILFNQLNVKRLPGYPRNDGDDARIMFYVDYPADVMSGQIPRSILASIIFFQLERLQNLTRLTIILNTPVTPPTPDDPTDDQRANAVVLRILDFSSAQWTTFYDTIFRRSVGVSLTRYCDTDDYTFYQDCQLSQSQPTFNLTDVQRIPGYPIDNGQDVNVSFYVTNPNNSNAVRQIVLASILLTQESNLEDILNQQIVLHTSAEPNEPPLASQEQINNSVVIRISSFRRNRWTYLNDRRLRSSIASRLAAYCNRSSLHYLDCQIEGRTTLFKTSDVQRSTANTPSDAVDNSIDYSFYVNYPNQNISIAQHILASLVKFELNAMQLESALFFSLQTPFGPVEPAAPTSDQSNNVVIIKILNQQETEWTAIEDNRLRGAIAKQIQAYCEEFMVECAIGRNETSFLQSHVTRTENSPMQDGDDTVYSFFVEYPSGSGPIQFNLLAGILYIQLDNIENETNAELRVLSSMLAPLPPSSSSEQNSSAVTVSASNAQDNQWTAILDNKFRGYVARAIYEYCTATEAQNAECELPGDDASFTHSNVQHVPGSPIQDGSNYEITFYVDYPGGGTMSLQILLLIIDQQLDSIATNTRLTLRLLTTVTTPTAAPPNITDNIRANALSVVLKDFNATEWPLRNTLFRINMAEEIREFCNISTYYRDICNISTNDLNNLTSSNIHLLPDSPTQDGNDSILEFYAEFSSGRVLPKHVLGTIFAKQQEQILSLPSGVQNLDDILAPAGERENLTVQQRESGVPISVLNLPVTRFTFLDVIDIKVTFARRMNIFCFSTSKDTCSIGLFDNEFQDSDIIVDLDSVMAAGENTVFNITVTKPGENTSIAANIAEDALYQSIQENGRTDETSLQLAFVNTPIISPTERENALRVRLHDTLTNEWNLDERISFRENMSAAIIQFCGRSEMHLARCNITRAQLVGISFLNVQPLPESPTQDGTDAILSFFVNLPGGTMPLDLLTTIFVSLPNIISRRSSAYVTEDIRNNTVSVLLRNYQADQWPAIDYMFRRNMSDAIKEFCNTSAYHRTLCNISTNDLNELTPGHIQLLPNSPAQNDSDSILTFYAVLPSGNIIPKHILGTIFVNQQENILAIESMVQDLDEIFAPLGDRQILTVQQRENRVPILIIYFPATKFTFLEARDIKKTIAQRMTTFCFRTTRNTCNITTYNSTSEDEFQDTDIIVDPESIMGAGQNTKIYVVVNKPGERNAVPKKIVEFALYETLQENNRTVITNLQLAIVNAQAISNTERENALHVRLHDTQADECST